MDGRKAMQIAAEFKVDGKKLYNNRVGVIRDDVTTMTAGGLHIPGSGLKKQSGTIVLIGEGVERDKELVGVRVGDRILFNKYEPLLISIPCRSGEEIPVVVMHSHDLYLGWSGDGLYEIYEEELEKLKNE